MPRRILMLMSDTGGGHRAVCHAVRDVLVNTHGADVEIDVVDGFKQYTPVPFKYAPDFYPVWIAHSKRSWGFAHNITDTKARARSVSRVGYVTMARHIKTMLRNHPADVVMCAHPLLVSMSLDALMSFADRPPFVTVVTDYASTHHFWYDRRADQILVPSKQALDRGLHADVPADKLRITGLPVNPSFANRLTDKSEARAKLGLLPDKITVLMLGGGEGMGPLYRMAREIDSHKLDIQLIVVAGKNKQLKYRLEASAWNQPTWIYPFTREMPALMSAADIIVTKAGAASITEALTAGLPIIISDVIPGQETGNVQYILDNKAGEYPGSPAAVGETVVRWVREGREQLEKRSQDSLRVARPNAAAETAEVVWKWSNYGRIPTHRRNILNRIEEIRTNLLP